MVKKITLNVESRTEQNGQAKAIRRQGFVPAVLYGPKVKPLNLKVKLNELEKAYDQAGESTLINLIVDGADSYKVIIKDVQRGQIKSTITHADFYKVDMKKAIEVEIPLHFIGEAKAEKELGGTIIKNTETVNVKCLPADLVDFIEVDISGLNTFDDMIHFKDLKLNQGMEFLNHPDDAVVHVIEPKAEAEPVMEAAPAAEPEKAEGEQPAKEDKKEK